MAEAAAVTLKLPPFWPADPEIWFTQVEAQFATKGVTIDNTKYHYLVASLSPETAAEVRELLIAPPDTDKYKKLKEAVIKRTTSSAQARIKQVLTAEELDGRKPSTFLRRLRQLIGNNQALISDDLLKQLFVSRLPSHAQAILATSEADSLEKMAETADKIMEVVGPQIAAVDSSSEVAELRKEILEMKGLLRSRDREPQGAKQRNRSRTPGPRSADGESGLCWFHFRFGNKAKKCRDPCSFVPENATGSR